MTYMESIKSLMEDPVTIAMLQGQRTRLNAKSAPVMGTISKFAMYCKKNKIAFSPEQWRLVEDILFALCSNPEMLNACTGKTFIFKTVDQFLISVE